MIANMPPVGGSVEPHFIYDQPDPGKNRLNVFARAAHWPSDRHLGSVYETAGAGWVADWSTEADQTSIAMPGFTTQKDAASALYWFEPPKRSMRSAQWHTPTDTWVNGTITFRGETTETAVEAVYRAVEELLEGQTDVAAQEPVYDVTLRVGQ